MNTSERLARLNLGHLEDDELVLEQALKEKTANLRDAESLWEALSEQANKHIAAAPDRADEIWAQAQNDYQRLLQEHGVVKE